MLAVALATVGAPACRKGVEPPPPQEELFRGEPEEYSATVVRTVEDGATREVSVTRVARSGGMFREEWTEQGHARALILRPDLGKSFLIFPDDRTYVESEPEAGARPRAEASPPSVGQTGEGAAEQPQREAPSPVDPDDIDRAVGASPTPARVETRALPDQTVEGYSCAVTERQAVFDDGSAEVTRSFCARELGGLALRVEVEGRGVKIVTERRDIETRVPPDRFAVPAGFKKLPRGRRVRKRCLRSRPFPISISFDCWLEVGLAHSNKQEISQYGCVKTAHTYHRRR